MANDLTTEIATLTADDKKIMCRHLLLMFKIFCSILMAVLILMCLAADWQTKTIVQIVLPVWLLIVLLIVAGFLVWYILINKQFKNPYKMIISGTVVDAFISNGRYPEFNVFMGNKLEEFKLLRGYDFPKEGINIGDKIVLHYILKAEDKLGSLITVKKLNPSS